MSFSDRMRWVAQKTLSALNHLQFIAPLLARLVIGYAFYQTGSGKLGNLEGTTGFFAELGIPAPHFHAVFIACLECFGGILLMLGLFTRIIAALLGCTMVVALMTADRMGFLNALKGEGDKGLTDVVPLMYGMFLLYFLLMGPGKASVDYLLGKWLKIDQKLETQPETLQPTASARLRQKHA